MTLLSGPSAVEAVARELLRRAPSAGPTRVVAIDGRAGSGKSTLSRPLAEALGAPVVALEDLYGGWGGLEAGVDRLISEVLEPLAQGRPVLVPEYDWWRTAWREPWPLEPPATLIVEGVGAAAARVRPYLALSVWMEVDDAARKARALERDDGVFTPFWDEWAAQEDAMLARDRTREAADLLIDGAAVLPSEPTLASPATQPRDTQPGEPQHGAAQPQEPQSGAALIREAARVLLLDDTGHVLLIQMREPATGAHAWIPPGGGIEPGEPAERAAVREVWEETGLRDVKLGPEVWRRAALVTWNGQLIDSRERWWIAHTPRFTPEPALLSDTEQAEILAWRWWSLDDLLTEHPPTIPRDLSSRLATMLRDGPPAKPLYLPT